MEGFDAGDIVIPMIKLIQGTSNVKAGRSGQFINTNTNEVSDHAELILITYSKEEKDWNDGKGPKPQYKFLALDMVTKMPVFLYVGGTSLWPAKAYLNVFWQQGVPLWYAVTGIASVSKDNKAGLGKYYVMAFEAMSDTDEATRKECYDFYTKYGHKMIDSKFEEDVEEAAGIQDVNPSERRPEDDDIKLEDVPL